MMKLNKDRLLDFANGNKVLFGGLFVIIFMFILLFSFNRGTYSVDELVDSLVINCPDKVSGGDEIECSIDLTSVTMVAKGISSNFDVSDGLTFVSFTPNSSWNDYANNENGFVLVNKNSEGVTGNSNVGIVKYTIPTDAVANTVYKIGLSNAEVGDGDVETINFDSVLDEVRVISNINTLESIGLSSGTINEVFEKDKKEYTANVDNDKVTIDVVKTDSNSVVSGDIGEVELHYGTNTFNIDVTSEAGVKNTYKISIYRSYEFSSDKYVYNKEDGYLYTYNDVSDATILNNISLEDGLSKKIENSEKLVISYNEEELLELDILNISFNDTEIDNKVITLYGNVKLEDFAKNINISSKLLYSVFNGNDKLNNSDLIVDNSVLKVYYNDKELDSYNIKVIPFSYSIDDSLVIDEDNSFINYLTANIKVTSLLSKFTVVGGNVKIFDRNNNEKSSDSVISTGDKVIIYRDGKIFKEYLLSVLGDSDGDGSVGMIDLVQIRKLIVGWIDPSTNEKYQKSGVYYNALDLDKNGSVGMVDLVKIRKIIVGLDDN